MALGYPGAQDLSESEQNLLNYFHQHSNEMMNHSYAPVKLDLTHSPSKNNAGGRRVNHTRPVKKAVQDSTGGDDEKAQLQLAMEQSLAEAQTQAATGGEDDEAQLQLAIKQSREEAQAKTATWLMTKTAIENQLLRASTATRQVHDEDSWWDHRCFWHAVVHAIGECDQHDMLLRCHHNATFIKHCTEASLRDAILDHMIAHPQRFVHIWASLEQWQQDYQQKHGTGDCTWQDYCNTLR